MYGWVSKCLITFAYQTRRGVLSHTAVLFKVECAVRLGYTSSTSQMCNHYGTVHFAQRLIIYCYEMYIVSIYIFRWSKLLLLILYMYIHNPNGLS